MFENLKRSPWKTHNLWIRLSDCLTLEFKRSYLTLVNIKRISLPNHFNKALLKWLHILN
jgi:hypothetical protein